MLFRYSNIVSAAAAVTLGSGLFAGASAQGTAPNPVQLSTFCGRVDMISPEKLTGPAGPLPARPSDSQIRAYCQALGFTERVTTVAPVVAIGTTLKTSGIYEGPTNVETTSRDELLKRGSPSMEQLIRSLTESGLNENGDNRGQNSFGIGVRTINLRNLGAGRTLILFDGVRLADDPTTNGGPGVSRDPNVQGGGAQNVNNIPMEVLAQVEILNDGGSASLGGDASGGAINFTPRRDLNGFEIGASFAAGLPLIIPALVAAGANRASR